MISRITQKRFFSSEILKKNMFTKNLDVYKNKNVSYEDIVMYTGISFGFGGFGYGVYESGKNNTELPETIITSSISGLIGFFSGIGLSMGILPVGFGIYQVGKYVNKNSK